MVVNGTSGTQLTAVLFSCGLDSAVLLASAARTSSVQPVYVAAGLAWERHELECARRLLASAPYATHVEPLARLSVDMRDVFPEDHWAVLGRAPAFDTPDEEVYIQGRNVVLLAKASVYMARAHITRILMGTLAGNPFPDATPEFLGAMQRALSLGLGVPIRIEAPLTSMHKADVIRLGAELGVPFELTVSCMQSAGGRHCGRCSKCRERRDGFLEAGIPDPTEYAERPVR